MRDVGWNSNQDVGHYSRRSLSGEAELNAIVKSIADRIGVQSLARDLGVDLTLVDSSAAVGMVNRSGVGLVRHFDVKDLWVQERVKRGSFSIAHMSGYVNPTDVATKKVKSVGAEILPRKQRWADMDDCN